MASRESAQHDKALRDYNRAIELDPNSADAHSGRGLFHLFHGSQKDTAKALSDLLRACELTEFKSWGHMHRLAMVCENMDKHAEAAKWYREIEKDFKRRGEKLWVYVEGKAESCERRAKEQENK